MEKKREWRKAYAVERENQEVGHFLFFPFHAQPQPSLYSP